MGRTLVTDQTSSVSAPLDPNADGEDIQLPLREHVASPDCWCHPIEESQGVWVHRLDPDALDLFEGYTPDLGGAIQGDDATQVAIQKPWLETSPKTRTKPRVRQAKQTIQQRVVF
jgi:hypothetical protein